MPRTRTTPMSEEVTAANKVWAGAKIRKYFGKHGWHEGRVKFVWKLGSKFFYRVVYEDQDKEDMDDKAVRRHCISRVPKATSFDSALTSALSKYKGKAVEKMFSGHAIKGVVKNAKYASGNRIVFQLSFKNKKTEEVGLRDLTKLLVEEVQAVPQPKKSEPNAVKPPQAKPEDEETDDVISDTDDDGAHSMDTEAPDSTPTKTPSVAHVPTANATKCPGADKDKSLLAEGTTTPIEA